MSSITPAAQVAALLAPALRWAMDLPFIDWLLRQIDRRADRKQSPAGTVSHYTKEVP